MVIADGQLYAAHAPLLELPQEVPPTGGALTVGQLHAQYAPAATPIDPHRGRALRADYAPGTKEGLVFVRGEHRE